MKGNQPECCRTATVRCDGYCIPCAAALFLEDHNRHRSKATAFLLEYGRELDEVSGTHSFEELIEAVAQVINRKKARVPA